MFPKISKFSRYFFLTILTVLLFAACQKDDSLVDTAVELETADHHHNQETSYIKIQDVPHIKNFLDTESNGRSLFEIDKSVYNRQTRSNEPNLVIGELQTTEIIKVTDGVRSNYTFILTTVESNNPNSISIFNLIVVENAQGLFSYITEYRPTLSWYDTYRNNNDLSSFTGEMLYFTIDGSYMAKAILDQGTITFAETRNPCDPNNDNNDTNGGGGGGGGDGGPGGDGSDGGGNGDGGDGGNGGVDITVYTRCCYDVHSSSDDPDCTCGDIPDIIIINMDFTDTTSNNENYLLDPCDDIIVDCADDVGDPCTCNATGDGCADEPDDNDDPVGIGVLIDLNSIFIANAIEDNITSVNLDPCPNTILTQIKSLQQNDLSTVIYRFDSPNTPYSTDIVSGIPTIPSNVAETNWKFDASNNAIPNSYEVIINPTFTNQATKIAIARTLLHEMLHAYMLSKVDDGLAGVPVNVADLPILWNAVQSGLYGSNPESVQHEQMAAKFITPLKDSLKEWDGGQQTDQYYEDLAWGALTNTGTFNFKFPVGSSDRIRIINTNLAEDTNSNQGGISPKGNPC